jgi:hypothetical protein
MEEKVGNCPLQFILKKFILDLLVLAFQIYSVLDSCPHISQESLSAALTFES